MEAAIYSRATEIVCVATTFAHWAFSHRPKLDYQHQCNELLDELRKDARTGAGQATEDHMDDKGQHGTKTIGRYTNALHFRDGLYSDIYKTTAPAENPDTFIGTTGSTVALKVTYLNGMAPPHNSEREVRILKRIAHPNIIPLWESFREPGYSHLVLVFPFMPYDLDMILRQGYIAEATGRGYLGDIFRALKHLHSMGIIHRDIKPSNILMKSPSGPAYLVDFGIIWSPDDPASEPADEKITDVGTTSYRPPEVLFGYKSYDQSLDLWAAGCVAAQVVTSSSRPLFESGDLGSDLTLIQSMFKKLGTPNTEIWPVCTTIYIAMPSLPIFH